MINILYINKKNIRNLKKFHKQATHDNLKHYKIKNKTTILKMIT
jgi:hypothetical protein